MTSTIIADGWRFRLTSYGNGTAYELWYRAMARRSIDLAGDDATQFRSELDALEAANPDTDTQVLLARLWDQYT